MSITVNHYDAMGNYLWGESISYEEFQKRIKQDPNKLEFQENGTFTETHTDTATSCCPTPEKKMSKGIPLSWWKI